MSVCVMRKCLCVCVCEITGRILTFMWCIQRMHHGEMEAVDTVCMSAMLGYITYAAMDTYTHTRTCTMRMVCHRNNKHKHTDRSGTKGLNVRNKTNRNLGMRNVRGDVRR